MRHALALGLALALAAPAAGQEILPPPPPPPSDDVPLPPPPPGTTRQKQPEGAQKPPGQGAVTRLGTIGEGPVAPAGFPGAPLHPDEAVSNWRFSLASGVAGRFNAYQLDPNEQNRGVMLYFGGQADYLDTRGFGKAARIRVRMLTGGESIVFAPSDGDLEAAYLIGRREFRFVVGRIEMMRAPGLALEALGQLSTLPSFEGSVAAAGDKVRLYYSVSPVELAWRYYYGRAHIDHTKDWPTESDQPEAATAFRARATLLLPPAVLLSVQGDYLTLWGEPDQYASIVGSAGFAILEQTVLLNVALRWESYTRRGTAPSSTETADQFMATFTATLVF